MVDFEHSCAHFAVPSLSKKDAEVMCACAVGFELTNDTTSCVAVESTEAAPHTAKEGKIQ